MIGTGLPLARRRVRAMNGVHDMGGMMGFGPVEPEPDEPVFHADWEGRVFGLTLACRRHRRLEYRHGPPAQREPAAGRIPVVELLRDLAQGLEKLS